jgi:IS30 family transposase
MTAYRRFTEPEKAEIWDRIEAGETVRSVALAFGRFPSAVRAMVMRSGGARPKPRRIRALGLSAAEREEISRGLAARQSCRAIAMRLARAPSTVTREVMRNGGMSQHRAGMAERRARRCGHRSKPSKLALRWQLREVVEAKLALKWSPQQISRWLQGTYPGDPEMHVSHETIYMSLYVQGRGAIAPGAAPRSTHGSGSPSAEEVAGQRSGSDSEHGPHHERPAEVTDRAVPGHWEGGLIMGRRKTCIGTLVKRSTHYLMLPQ